MSGSPDQLVSALQWGLIEAAARRDFRARLFTPGAACGCGVGDPQLLILGRSPACCYECDLLRRTGSRYERHHVGGNSSSITVLLSANRHRLHSVGYQDVVERLPLTAAERLWLELQLFVYFERLLDEAGGKR
jgi:hypothetical protein